MPPSREAPRACIVTTVKHVGAPLQSFVAHHLRIGFERIFVFWEGGGQQEYQALRAHPRVSILEYDDEVRRCHRANPLYDAIEPFIDKEVMARQVLNARVAVSRATAMGYDWILHLDADELFVCSGTNVSDHFAALDAAGVAQSVYLNHEAVPETEEIGDYFREVTLFKVNPKVLQKNSPGVDSPVRFVAYITGKAAARLQPGLLPHGVHRFREYGSGRSVYCYSAQVLHYPSCGLSRYIAKYKDLGEFATAVGHWAGMDRPCPQYVNYLHPPGRRSHPSAFG